VRGTLNQKSAIRLLEDNGWTRIKGGRHQVKMVKKATGRSRFRLIAEATIPALDRGDLSTGRSKMNRPILRMEITANIRLEEGSYWADVPALPGCFASGQDLNELFDSLQEGIELYLSDEQTELAVPERPLRLTAAVLSDAVA
jgi:predicted RNase H-like HicB family nuclease